MNMGSKEKNDPNNFSQKDQNIIKKSPQVSSFSHPDFTQEKSVKGYKSKGLGGIETDFGTLGDTRVTKKLKSKVLKK